MPDFSDYIVFVDESGDHGMVSIDPYYPIFVLALCIVSKEEYAGKIAPAMLRFKFRHFGHDQVILHEYDIRKARGPFAFLVDAGHRESFISDLDQLVAASPFRLIAGVIRKDWLRRRSPVPDNPYHVALGIVLQHLYDHLRQMGCRHGVTHLLFERRGEREDAELELEFRRVCDAVNPGGERMPFEIILADKRCNSTGLQLADLIARPIGRHLLDPLQPNRAYETIRKKFVRNPAEGWKEGGPLVFP